jgi:hypothetical protein
MDTETDTIQISSSGCDSPTCDEIDYEEIILAFVEEFCLELHARFIKNQVKISPSTMMLTVPDLDPYQFHCNRKIKT